MAVPALVCTSTLVENGRYLFLPVASPRKGAPARGRIDVLLDIAREPLGPGDPQPPGGFPTLVFTAVTVSFPGSSITPRTYPVAGELKGEKGRLRLFLDDAADPIIIGLPAPATIEITLATTGFDSAVFTWPLGPHHSPTVDGSYAFPFKAADLDSDENGRYVVTGVHAGGQMFANDMKIVGWDAARKAFVPNPGHVVDEVMHGQLIDDDRGKNEDHLLWDMPIYAAADGFVLQASDRWQDNPRPYQSMVYTGTQVTLPEGARVLTVGEGGANRVLTVIADATNRLRMVSHRAGEGAESLVFEGISEPTPLPMGSQSMTMAMVSSSLVVTAGHDKGASVLMLWKVGTKGSPITIADTALGADVQAVKVERLSTGRLVMARQAKKGNFEVSVWEVNGSTLPKTPLASTSMGGPTAMFDVTVLEGTNRFVSATLTSSGKVKLTVWDVSLTGDHKVSGIVRRTSLSTGDQAVELSICATSVANEVCVAARTVEGTLRLYFCTIDEAGVITATAVVSPDEKVSQVSVLRFKRGVATAGRTSTGRFRLIGWALLPGNAPGEAKVRRSFTLDDAATRVGAVVMANVTAPGQTATVAVGLSSTTGSPRLLLCTLAPPNDLHLLCGNEVVYYAHWRRGSLSKKLLQPGAMVKKGELLARAGSSGQSDVPHLHMGVDRLDLDDVVDGSGEVDEATKKLIIEKFAAGQIARRRRGMPFHGVRAMLAAELVPGGLKENPFEGVHGQGFIRGDAVFPAPVRRGRTAEGGADAVHQPRSGTPEAPDARRLPGTRER